MNAYILSWEVKWPRFPMIRRSYSLVTNDKARGIIIEDELKMESLCDSQLNPPLTCSWCVVRILLAAVTPKLSAGSHFSLVLLPPSLCPDAFLHLALVHARRYPRQGNFSPAPSLPPWLSLSAWNNTNVSFPCMPYVFYILTVPYHHD